MLHDLSRENLNWGYELPSYYGEDKLVLLLRDPYFLFAYWEITREKLNYYGDKFYPLGWEAGIPLLRVYRFPKGLESHDQREAIFDIELNYHADKWHIPAGVPCKTYYVELGRKMPGGEFIPVMRSNSVSTPRDSVSDIIDEEWRLFDLQQRIYRRMALYHLSSYDLQQKGIAPEEITDKCQDEYNMKIIT